MLLLTDPIDEFWIPTSAGPFQEKPFKSATKSGADLGKVASDSKLDSESEEKKPEDLLRKVRWTS